MIKYTVYKMGRIVVNKHFDDKSLVTSEKFVNKGEIIISNQPLYEGIFIKNQKGELVFIGPSEGTGADIPVDYKEYVNAAIDGAIDTKLSTQIDESVDKAVDERLETHRALLQNLSAATMEEFERISENSANTLNYIKSFSASTVSEINRLDNSINALRDDFEDIAAGVIDEEYIKTIVDKTIEESLESLEGDITETVNKVSDDIVKINDEILTISGNVNNIKDNITTDITTISGAIIDLRADLSELSAYTQNIEIGGGGPVEGGLSREEVEEICSFEVAKIVAGADSNYDTLKEIADWIINDTTGSAQMANDIENIKSQLNALILGAKSTIKVNPSIIYNGVETEVKITGELTPDTLTPCEIFIYKGAVGGELIATGITTSVEFTDVIINSTTYAVKAIYNNTPYTASTRVNAYYPTYCGFGVSIDDVITNGTKKLTSSAKGNYNAIAETDGVNYYILVPTGVTKPTTFTMGGAPFNMVANTEFIDGINYEVFKSGSLFNKEGAVNIKAE